MTGPHRHKHRDAGTPVTLGYFRERSTLDPATGCWIWTGAISPGGYGVVRNGKATTRAHRLAYVLATGADLTPAIDVCHRCDVRACCNPDHLFAGSRRDNMADCAAKGRIRTPNAPGERCPAAKLTAAQVTAIRLDDRSSRALGRVYGVDKGTIQHIRAGRTWRSV